jgi:uracil-DNA glycosylase family 4
MDEFAQELADLTADLKAVLLDAQARGVQALVEGESPQPVASNTTPQLAATPPAATPPAATSPAATSPAATPPAATPPVGTALDRIRAELGDCTRCALSKGRNQLVFGGGNPKADLLVVGEAPGGQEDRVGLPFVGPAGRMLEDMLVHVLGLGRDQVYITNVVKCRPPSNRTPLPEEIDTCRTFLEQQVQAVAPKVILALGRPATQTLLESTRGIKSLRGTWSSFKGIPVLPTFHPAYLLRQAQDKRLVFEDLKALRKRYDELGGLR